MAAVKLNTTVTVQPKTDAKTSSRQAIRIGIIGTAARDAVTASRMTAALFDAMLLRVQQVIEHEWKMSPRDVHLVSGGSAWCDHLAVRLFLADSGTRAENERYSGLTLYLPCTTWDVQTSCPKGTPDAKRLVDLHQSFATQLGYTDSNQTLKDVTQAQANGAQLHVGSKSFSERNRLLANHVDYLIALTWDDGPRPLPKSGTVMTWNLASRVAAGRKLHLPLSSLSSTFKK